MTASLVERKLRVPVLSGVDSAAIDEYTKVALETRIAQPAEKPTPPVMFIFAQLPAAQSVRDDGFESHSLLNSLNSIGLGDDESRRLGIAQGGEHGRGRKESREFVDERDHSAMPKAVEAKEVHFFDGLLGRPLLRGAAVGRDENAGAVFA
jgi:hypothetical protein